MPVINVVPMHLPLKFTVIELLVSPSLSHTMERTMNSQENSFDGTVTFEHVTLVVFVVCGHTPQSDVIA